MLKDFIFTSELLIKSDNEKLERKLFENRVMPREFINDFFNKFNPKSKINEENFDYLYLDELGLNKVKELKYILSEYNSNFHLRDITCCLKGMFMTFMILNVDLHDKHTNFVISFGGDIFGFRTPNIKINIKDSKQFIISPNGMWGCFTSGNYDSRGSHILSKEKILNKSLTLFGKCDYRDLAFMDAYTTFLYSNNNNNVLKQNYTIIEEKL